MRPKNAQKAVARQLRESGWSIPDIALMVSVAKSSVSMWVRDIPQPEKFTAEFRAKRKKERLIALEKARAENKGRPKKERLVSGDGRWMIQAPEGYEGKTYIGKRYVYEHRYLMEQKLGRLLRPGEVVHHKNEDKLDNRMENIELTTKKIHDHLHAQEKKKAMVRIRCPSCGSEFNRQRRATHLLACRGVALTFCNRSCSGRFYGRKPSGNEIEKARTESVLLEYSE